ncbi:hypothetical protein [Halobaculum litoreum]|uniref:hypothetical protein n=1 Tax=Halobaculum litoreum TaxID=3031998 RepID=UPI0024C360A1|nr:hypothetical protein [Halobaculum sp. DT92]
MRKPPSDGVARRVPRVGSWSKEDLVLAVVPALLLAGVVGGTALPVPTPTAAGVGSALAALVVAYALFVSPPVDRGRRR